MISEKCSIDEFVEAVKDKDTWEVLTLAVDEATWADRMAYRTRHNCQLQPPCGQQYSRHLKRLINYLRFEVKPKRPGDKAYRLYLMYWGNNPDDDLTELLTGPPTDAVH
jgi:hypothetical protein